MAKHGLIKGMDKSGLGSRMESGTLLRSAAMKRPGVPGEPESGAGVPAVPSVPPVPAQNLVGKVVYDFIFCLLSPRFLPWHNWHKIKKMVKIDLSSSESPKNLCQQVAHAGTE